MHSVKLIKDLHDRDSFDCGVDVLNHYLMMMANQQAGRDNSRTYVITPTDQPHRIIGYYTLTMASVDLTGLPTAIQKKHRQAATAGLIARLAVDKRYAKQGFGEWLLIDALRRLLDASETVGFPLVVVDAKDGVSDFYKRFSFTTFEDIPNKLFMTIADIRHSLGQAV